MKADQINQLTKVILNIYQDVPFDEFYEELKFIQSRLKFIDLKAYKQLTSDNQIDYLCSLLEEGASELVLPFLEQLSREKLLETLLDQDFEQAIQHLRQRFETLGEVKFFTAVEMSDNLRKIAREALDKKYPEALRTVFLKNPDLVAGFLLIYKDQVYDFTLKTHGPKIIYANLEKEFFKNV